MSSPESPDVIIVNYRDCAETIAAAESLMPWALGTLWLVDNSGMPDEAAALRAYATARPWVQVLVPAKNLGFGGGCNLAFARSAASFVLLLNPDARIGAADVRRLVAVMAADARLGAVSPKMFWDTARRFVIPPSFRQTPAMELGLALAQRFPAAARSLALRHVRRLRIAMGGTQLLATPFLTGAVLLLRREAVIAAGGLFDPEFFMFFEDTDLSTRLRRAGHRLAVDPVATAVHTYRHKATKWPLMAESRHRYFGKHHALFYRCSGRLRWLSVLGAAKGELPARLGSAADFNRFAEGGVVAWSPSPVLLPAIFRPDGCVGVPLSAEDWAALEPGQYTAAVEGAGGGLRVVSFERAADGWRDDARSSAADAPAGSARPGPAEA